jgi:hypothetical protein
VTVELGVALTAEALIVRDRRHGTSDRIERVFGTTRAAC